ncbi:hypothetical protein ACW7G0_03680 [Lysobacter sp. A286]
MSLPAIAGAGSALPCSGVWDGAMYGPHGRLMDRTEMQLEFWNCGERLQAYETRTNEPAAFSRTSRLPNTYSRTEQQGGFTLAVDYRQQTPRQMSVTWDFNGQATHTGTLTYLRPLPSGTMELLAADCKDGRQEHKIDDPKTPEEARALANGKQLFETVLAVVGERVVETADKPLRDYLTLVPASRVNGKTRVVLRVANDGSLLPDPGNYAMDHTRCVEGEREYVPTASFLYFTAFELVDTGSGSRPTTMTRVTKNPDGTQTSSRQSLDVFYDTQLQQVDFETGKITKAQHASSSEPGDMQESVEAVMQAMRLGSFRLNDGFASTGQ